VNIALRPARQEDVDFARELYFETMRGMIEELLGWDQRRQEDGFVSWFKLEEAAIIVADGRPVGWFQTRVNEQEIFLGSLYVSPEMQRRGIGSDVLRQLVSQAVRASKTLRLAVMRNNPAVKLYERLGFQVTHDDQYKLYMQFVPPRPS
jgi:ribosomal protein S18 acetylase RimI-like enzyme